MTERRLLLQPWQVLAGLKGELRKVAVPVNPQPVFHDGHWYWKHPKFDNGSGANYFHSATITPSILEAMTKCCLLGIPGDVLWWAETWGYPIGLNPGHSAVYVSYKADKTMYHCHLGDEPLHRKGVCTGFQEPPSWRPADSMPRWASRGASVNTGVDVKRLWDVTWQDALAAGTPYELCCPGHECNCGGFPIDNPLDDFRDFWDSRYHKRFSWDSNPWVWLVSLENKED